MNIAADPIPFVPSWPDPDNGFMGGELPPAPKLSQDEITAIFGPLAPWSLNAAKAKSCPFDYVALSSIAIFGAILGKSRWVQPRAAWREPPIIWAALIGGPSSGKSPAIRALSGAVSMLEAELNTAYTSELAEWETNDEIARMYEAQWKADSKAAIADGGVALDKPAEADAGPRPERSRISVTDATVEKVAELQARLPDAFFVQRDELSGWFESMGRYNNGGDRPFWLECFGGGSYSVDRKSHGGSFAIQNLAVGILGGIQPEKLAQITKAADDGLMSRCLMVFPDRVASDWDDIAIDDNAMFHILKRLHSLRPAHDGSGPLGVHLTEDAKNKLKRWADECDERNETGLLGSHIGKMKGLTARIALILTYADWAAGYDDTEPASIDGKAMDRAIFYAKHLLRHAERVYSPPQLSADMLAARLLAELIVKEKLTTFRFRDIQRRCRRGLSERDEIKQAIAILERFDWIRRIEAKAMGRPSEQYGVNPKIYG